ncbi:MAG TPA: hypothetical protein VMS00_10730 [Acidimicrobiales bacterium]|nr:hypothetical protein [Acidimicrobiales bacterium]
MADKLEVLPGPGLVARFGEVAVWAGPQCSSALQAHLVSEAQRQGAYVGDQLASSFIAVLQRGDPEPQAPFAIVGPGVNGLALFLHGPVQAWDSGRWLAPQPVPGWMATSIGRPWPLIILPYGAAPPPQSQQGNPFDLLSGAVPGSGFVLLRPQPGPAQAAGAGQATGLSLSSPGSAQPGPDAGAGGPVPFGGQPGYGAQPGGVGTGPGGAAPGPGGPGPMMGSAGLGQSTTTVAPGANAGTVGGGPAGPANSGSAGISSPSGGAIDLRNAFAALQPSLPVASSPAAAPTPGRPEVQGVRCEVGHFNHPRVTQCMRCGRPVPQGSPQVSAPRPATGVLLADEGSIWALDRPCIIGSEPTSAAEVQAGVAQAIAMRAAQNHPMAPVHAEVQAKGWSAYLVDRGADGGTFFQGPGAQGWAQLGRNEQRELADGSHISCGGRVLTYLAAWPA